MNFYFLSLFKYILASDPGLGTSKQVFGTENPSRENPLISTIPEDTGTGIWSFDLSLLSDLNHSSSTMTCLSPLNYEECPIGGQNHIPFFEDEYEIPNIADEIQQNSTDRYMSQHSQNPHKRSHSYFFKRASEDRVIDNAFPNVLVDGRPLYEENILVNIEKSRALCNEGDKNFIFKRFNMVEELGRGSYGVVCLFTTIDLHVCCAVKCTYLKNPCFPIFDEVEICEVLRNINHKNIIKVYGIIPQENLVYIFMEYSLAKSLFNHVKHNFADISEDSKRNIMLQLLDGIEYLLNINIVHGDLSTSNILVDGKGLVKIIDFGFSKILSKGKTIQTPPVRSCYLAPGRIKGLYRRSDDLWSFAIAMYFLYHFNMPFTDDEFLTVDFEVQPIWDFDKNIPADAKDLMEKMLRVSLTSRLGGNDEEDIEIIRKQPYFRTKKRFGCSTPYFRS